MVKSKSYEVPRYVFFSILPLLYLSVLSNFVLTTLNLRSSLRVRNQVQHPYQTTDKIAM
jgi:hypothetical protein